MPGWRPGRSPSAARPCTSPEPRARRAAGHRGGPRSERLAAFLRLWTLKEALLKAAGTGLHGPLAVLDLASDAARVECALPLEPGGRVAAVAEYRPLGAGWHLAVARLQRLGAVRVFAEDEDAAALICPGGGPVPAANNLHALNWR